ncbi:putative NXPE family member 3-like isoform X2 [Apostichopus japonicus]|uniref:Putative NXPE family member 3-like isoform X2 n=1 Tax=Stichopus japonicus TaxID=307972 RepID=A0A2G8KU44_STIJA|nr:putative NXPE family member 3-like isoform X2 [Apostichopus japonicus]
MDSLNRSKSYGGDMFRVKLFSGKPYAAVNADHLIDFQNGTYLAIFRILWEGQIDLQVLLVHPAEAISLFLPTIKGGRSVKALYKGGFETKDDTGKMHQEKPFCNFSDNQIYAPWFCSSPKDNLLNCSHWKTHATDKAAIQKLLQAELDQTAEEILKRSKSLVYRSKGLITVQQRDNSTTAHYAEIAGSMLPYCKPEGPPPIKTNGYFFQNIWYPLNCRIKHFSKEDILECLNGKTVRIFGDSTSRQVYEVLQKFLKCKSIPLDPPRNSSRLDCRCRINNVTLHFQFHGLPTKGSNVSPISGIHYAANDIDRLEGGPGTIIFLSYWAHFTMTGMDFYKKRLESVRDALDRLLARSPPGTKIYMKGANTRNYSVKTYQLISSDWIALQFEFVLRELYKDYKEFGFIDTWDITQVQPFPDNVHPKAPIISNYIDRLMTYTCET